LIFDVEYFQKVKLNFKFYVVDRYVVDKYEREQLMFDPKFLSLAQIRHEEMKHNVDYERIIRLYDETPSLRMRLLAGTGRLLIRWGTILQKRYDKQLQQPVWVNTNQRMERVL
jgi:hypothetical protein